MIDAESTISPDPEAEQFYEGAYVRIMRSMVVFAVIFTIAAEIKFGWRTAGGFLVGCGLAVVNFLWLKRTIATLASKIIQPQAETASKKPTTKWLLRYALFGGIAYVIFKSSILSLTGVMVGLFLPVAAILTEAVYETYAALRH